MALPTLKDLHHDINAAGKMDDLNTLLNQPPPEAWLKPYPAAMGIQGKYMPIDKVEYLLTRIFQEWHPEIISFTVLLQTVSVHVRLHYKNPLTGEWSFKDGLGGCPVQVDAGAQASDLTAIKSRAVQIALPIAESAAIKDAAEHFGTLFGKDLNRKDTVMFAGSYNDTPPPAAAPTTIQSPSNYDNL